MYLYLKDAMYLYLFIGCLVGLFCAVSVDEDENMPLHKRVFFYSEVCLLFAVIGAPFLVLVGYSELRWRLTN